MLPKWRSILIHWIHCYSNNEKDEAVNLNSLLDIIAHLRENFSLDESKSSLLEAYTIEQFIIEKFPHFKFDHGTVVPTTEVDFYLAASLLLYFVCVNSKQIDIKNAMCSKLSTEDQELILKFSKSLMESSPILCRDVEAAIAEACGHNIAIANVPHSVVAETPPALRSLHSEVRRLQAALEAERFDRNYLQEELARTNAKFEKLSKDKEQYKLEIMDLKAQISLCCGQEENAKNSDNTENSAKIAKELQDMENRLVQTKEELDEVIYERDALKAKIEEIKQDRDKWFALSQEETAQVSQLSEQLEIEKSNVSTLKELVSELRQHNRLNRFDSSLLECDDPNASIQSLPHNISICSEVCANVVEVQLGEERAKIVELKQQIQALQDQVKDLNETAEKERQSHKIEIREKESDIFNLKHRINEEIEQKDHLKMYYDNEMTKLNNEINELEQRLKDNGENSRKIIERKMLEIQTLQEEKLTLLQSLSDETAKLDNIIKTLKKDLDNERHTKASLKDSYESHVMKLNEKMLNRNNELVELQNNVCLQSETIERLHLDLRNEKEKRVELTNKFDRDRNQLNDQIAALFRDTDAKTNEIKNIKMILEQKTNLIEDLYKEVNSTKSSLSKVIAENNILEETKTKLMIEVEKRDAKLVEIDKDIENLKNVLSEERDKLIFDLDEKNATINTLKSQLESEIHFKVELQNELMQLQKDKFELLDTLNKTNNDLVELQKVMNVKDLSIQELNNNLVLTNTKIDELQTVNSQLSELQKNITDEINKKNDEMQLLILENENKQESFKSQLHARDDALQEMRNTLSKEVSAKETVQVNLKSLMNEKENLGKECMVKTDEISELQIRNEELTQIITQHETAIETLKENLETEQQMYKNLENDLKVNISSVKAKLDETEQIKLNIISENERSLQNKDLVIEALENDLKNFKTEIKKMVEQISHTEEEKQALKEQLNEVQLNKINIEGINKELNIEVQEIMNLNFELDSTISKLREENEILNHKIIKINETVQLTISQKENKIKNLDQEIHNLKELNMEAQHTVESKNLMIELLKKEKENINRSLQDYKNNAEITLKEKEELLVDLHQKLKKKDNDISVIKVKLEELETSRKTVKLELTDSLQCKEFLIDELQKRILELEEIVNNCEDENNKLKNSVNKHVNEKEEIILKFEEQIFTLKETLRLEEIKYVELLDQKNILESQLFEEKAEKDALETEKKELSLQKCNIADDYNDLLNEKAILAQEVCEERSVRRIVEEEKNNLLMEKHAIEEQLHSEVDIKNALIEEKDCLAQQLIDESLVREIIEREKKTLGQEKLLMEEKLVESDKKIKSISKELEALIQNQSTLNDTIMKEKRINSELKKDLDLITEETQCVKSKYNSVLTEYEKLGLQVSKLNKHNEELLKQVNQLEKELNIIKANYDVIVLEKNELLSGNKQLILCEEESKTELDIVVSELKLLKSKYRDVESENEKLASEVEKLKQDDKDLTKGLDVTTETLELFKSKYNELESENYKLKSEVDVLQCDERQLKDELGKAEQDLKELGKLHNEKTKLISELGLLKSCEQDLKAELQTVKLELKEIESKYIKLVAEKESFLLQKDQLETEVKETILLNETLFNDKELLLSENKRLFQELTDEKKVFDEIENERKCLQRKFVEMNNIHDNVLREKTEELSNITILVNQLKIECDDHLQLNNKISKNLNNNIKYIIETLRENNRNSEIVQKLSDSNNIEEISVQEKCIILTNIIEFLTNEVILKSKIEDALKHENSALNEMQEICKQKDIKMFELQTEIKRLEQVVAEYKTELSKKTETYTTSLNSKSKNVVTLQQENQTLHNDLNDVKQQLEIKVHSLKERLTDNENLTEKLKKSYECQIDNLNVMVAKLTNYLKDKAMELDSLRKEKDQLQHTLEEVNKAMKSLENDVKSATINQEKLITDFESERQVLKNMVTVTESIMEDQKICLNNTITEHLNTIEKLQGENKIIKDMYEQEKSNLQMKLKENDNIVQLLMKELEDLKNENVNLKKDMHDKNIELENAAAELNAIKNELSIKINEFEKLETQHKLVKEDLEKLRNDKEEFKAHNQELSNHNELLRIELQRADDLEKALNEQNEYNKHAELIVKEKLDYIEEIEEKLNSLTNVVAAKDAVILNNVNLIDILKKENEELTKVVDERNACAVVSRDKSPEGSHVDHKNQVDNSSNLVQSLESLKTIADLERIVHDKNLTITTLQSDVNYMKSLMAESETKLMDVTKELELSKENNQQLSSQLKKIVYQKNEEIAELKKQLNKMTIMENRASQIIKVSAKYQAIILRRIAEIKSNTVLKELTNFGNSNTCDNELRRNLNAGAITMEDLENFLETTEKHLRRCSEKQISLQKERDRLSEVNRINESEIINLKKYLTELSVTFQTFNSMKDMYSQKLSRIVSIQRTVRREILSLDGHINDSDMCKLERGYAAVMQDLAECTMNLQRWVERSISRAVSPEKIKQAFTTDNERASLAPTTFQNAGLEVQLEELENTFQKLLVEIGELRSGRGGSVRGTTDETYTVSELRAEYEDKLNRMKAKMKQLYQEQISIFKEKQREEISVFEKELEKAREKLAESSRAYEDHIKTLTTELWNVGEKYLMQRNEAEWLRRKQKSGSLMSLQHVHSSGLAPAQEEPSRPSDAHSLRSLPVNCSINIKKDRGLHMSEEGEVFDNRCLKELSATPRRDAPPPGVRLSELRWRNSLCPPHLKSSYPAETQFAPMFDEDDLKCSGSASISGKQKEPRKEVGITAYKKPGPPTPSKQAGRLSATDSELRESLRVEADPRPARKTGTPSRFRAMFRSNKNDTNEGTPRRRLSSIFRMK